MNHSEQRTSTSVVVNGQRESARTTTESRRCAAEIGLSVVRFTHDLEADAFAARVREDFLSGVRSGVNGTPTFFINGLRHDGPWDLGTLTGVILAAVH